MFTLAHKLNSALANKASFENINRHNLEKKVSLLNKKGTLGALSFKEVNVS